MCDLALFFLTVYFGPSWQFLFVVFSIVIFWLIELYAKINGKQWKTILPYNFRKTIKIYLPMFRNLNLFQLWLFLESDCFVYFLTISVFIWIGQMIMLNGDLDKIWTFYKKKLIRHQLLIRNSKWNVFLKIFHPPSVWVFGVNTKNAFTLKYYVLIIFKWRRLDDIQILFCL